MVKSVSDSNPSGSHRKSRFARLLSALIVSPFFALRPLFPAVSPSPLRPLSESAPAHRLVLVLSGVSPTFVPWFRLPARVGSEVSRPAYVVMKQFFKDPKQSAPWWLMLVLQVVEAVIQAFSNS